MKIVRSLVVIAICALVSSQARATVVLADWTGGTLGALQTGVASATPSPSFADPVTANGTLTFVVNLSPGYTANTVTYQFTYTVTGAQGTPHQVTVDGTQYLNNTVSPVTVNGTLGNISAGSSDQFSIVISGYSLQNGGVNFTDVRFVGNLVAPVPEPIAYALPLFGLIFIGGTAGRFYLGRRNKLEAGS